MRKLDQRENYRIYCNSWFTVNSALSNSGFFFTILVVAYLSVKHQVFHFIGKISFNPEFIRQTQESVLCWTNIGSAQINIANMRVLKTTKTNLPFNYPMIHCGFSYIRGHYFFVGKIKVQLWKYVKQWSGE